MSLIADWDCDNPRPEDRSVMPLHGTGFKIEPLGLSSRATPYSILRMAAPLAIAELARMLTGFVDTVKVSRLGSRCDRQVENSGRFCERSGLWSAYSGLKESDRSWREKFHRDITNEWSPPPFKDQTMQIEAGGVSQTRSRSSYPEVHHD